MKKEDIKLGDLVVGKLGWLARPVLVMSLEPSVYSPASALAMVTVLDCGVRTIVPVSWLEPTDGMDGSNLENWDVAAKKKREER